MIQIILDNAKIISLLFGLFGLFFLSNTMLGIYLNMNIYKEKFNKEILWNGVKRGMALCIGIISLVIGVSTIGTIINLIEILDVPPTMVDGLTIATIGTIIVGSTLDYATQSITKFKNIMTKENINNERN